LRTFLLGDCDTFHVYVSAFDKCFGNYVIIHVNSAPSSVCWIISYSLFTLSVSLRFIQSPSWETRKHGARYSKLSLFREYLAFLTRPRWLMIQPKHFNGLV
jgi:hypothetical protein